MVKIKYKKLYIDPAAHSTPLSYFSPLKDCPTMDVFHPYADKLGQILRLSYISPPWDSPMQEDIFPLLK